MHLMNVPAKLEVCSFTQSWDNRGIQKWGLSMSMPTQGDAVGGRRWYRSKVSSYRPSIVTFPLSLRVSEILPLLFSRTPLFITPPLVCPNFPMFSWEYVDRLLATKSEGVGLIAHAISFQDFQPMWSQITNVTDRLTDRRTTCDRKTVLCTKVHCAVITSVSVLLSQRLYSLATLALHKFTYLVYFSSQSLLK